MRKVVFGGAISLDNFIARKDGAFDWILSSKEAAQYMKEYWKTFDTIVMGRKTYEVALKYGNPSYPGMKNYVFSRTMTDSGDKNVEIISEDACDFIRRLKQKEGKDICVMGGGELAHALFEADLIDEIGFNIHPLLLGSGIPLFYEMSRQIDLELIKSDQFKNGCVLVTYRVKHKAPATSVKHMIGKKGKTTKKPTTIDQYLKTLSPEEREPLEEIRQVIKSAAPRAKEYISYGVPAFRLKDRLLVAFAAASKDSSFYPGAYPLAKHKAEVAAYDTSKGTIRFRRGKPLPLALIRKLVKARMEEQSKRAKK